MTRARFMVALGCVLLAAGCAETSGGIDGASGGSAGGRASDDARHERLVGTWRMDVEGVDGTVTYEPDGTWTSTVDLEFEGQRRRVTSKGTWRVEDGAIHNVTLDIGLPGLPTPYTSIEKLVSIDDDEYRYVCPVAGTTNRMVKVAGDGR